MQIQSEGRTVRELLQGGYYRVPRFQRPYSWGTSEAEEFWQDTLVESGKSYFIGSFVVFPSGQYRFDIVDGQQRLTTIFVALAAIRNAFLSNDDREKAQGLHGMIERRDVNFKDKFILETETSYPYLHARILSFDPSEDVDASKSEEQSLQAVFSLFERKLDNLREVVVNKRRMSAQRKKTEIATQLTKLRDKLLSLQLILINVEEEDDAYTIFETLNTRGKDLGISDLLKNLILKEVKTRNDGYDKAKEKWREMQSILDESDPSINPNTFISHSWLSRYSYVGKPKLFKTIKSTLIKSQRVKLLDILLQDSKHYRGIVDPLYRRWKNEEIKVRRSIEALNEFGVRQHLPFVLSVLRAYSDHNLPLRHARNALTALEHHHYVFTAVVQKSPSGGQSKMYALHARTLLESSSTVESVNCIKDLIIKLKSSLPSFDEFQANFKKLQFSSANTHQKKLVRYTLGKFYRHFGNDNEIDMSGMTVEHLLPESLSRRGDVSSDEYDNIGNLIFLRHDDNVKLGNKPWPQKRLMLTNIKNTWIDPTVLKADDWGRKEINERADQLAHQAYHTVWRF